MSDHLEPCPFCLTEDAPVFHNIHVGELSHLHYVRCPSCRAHGPTAYSPEKARRSWNGRRTDVVLGTGRPPEGELLYVRWRRRGKDESFPGIGHWNLHGWHIQGQPYQGRDSVQVIAWCQIPPQLQVDVSAAAIRPWEDG